MKQSKISLLPLIAIAGAFALRAGDPPAAEHAMPPMPQPAPQHEAMKKWSGTWDSSAKMYMPGMAAPMESKGIWSCKMMGGFWNICDLQSEMMGKPFLGHEIQGYDLRRKKITATWIDTMGDWTMPMEGTASPDGKTITMWGKGLNMAGKMSSYKTVGNWFDDDHYSWKMWEIPANKKPMLLVEVTYVRRK